MDGVLVIDKPAGMTSHDVVDRVRKALGTRKVGHGGTLDPDATGVLVLGIGRATRFLSYAQSSPKRYLASVRFGVTTTTQDASGEVLEEKAVDIGEEDVARELKAFEGEIEQVPPMVSAVKIGGERLYRKARRGETVERPARRVTIHDLKLLSFVPGNEASADLDVTCSGGTYIRTLASDLGDRLGCGAHLAGLQRIAAGGFELSEAVVLDEAGPDRLLPLVEVARDLESIELTAEQAAAVAHGRALAPPGEAPEGPIALIFEGELMGVYSRKEDRLVAERVVGR